MARSTRAELVIFHVFADKNAQAHERACILDLLEREAAEARSVQALARVRTAAGDPSDRILEAIAQEEASTAFLGADAHEGFVGALLGRVALRVVREAKAPVFVVRRGMSVNPTAPLRHRRIVAGCDFSSASLAAVDAAVALAKDTGGEVRIVHVLPVARAVESDEIARLRSRLEELGNEAAAKGVTATAALVVGDPATALIAETENDLDAVISLGASSRSRLSRFLLGDVTEAVLRTTDAMVLVTHAGPASEPLVALPM